jgi:hypothetical protein
MSVTSKLKTRSPASKSPYNEGTKRDDTIFFTRKRAFSGDDNINERKRNRTSKYSNHSNYSNHSISSKTRRAATRKIGRFLRRTDPRVRSKFLQSVCSDAGVCIAFGTNAPAIRKHFDDFNNFSLLSKPAERIGSVSSNGFVKELTYMNRGYMANAILKSSAEETSDNLLYEALVGFFLNKMSLIYPSFVETYGLYEYSADGLAYKECKDNASTNPAVLTSGLKRIANNASILSENVRKSCKTPTSMAVLIQHLKPAETIREKCEYESFLTEDLLYVLYQVYMSLSSLSDVFTHYDLHLDNVMVYEPVVGKHIEYHYYIPYVKGGYTNTFFRSKYIAKIIDYGRCYFNDKENTSNYGNSKSFYSNILCKECVPKCGRKSGYQWFEYNPKYIHDDYFICSQRLNPSHDLRLLSDIRTDDIIEEITPELKNIIDRLVYGKGMSEEDEMYGTEPNPVSGLPSKINNVRDAFSALEELVKYPQSAAANKMNYQNSNKLGELHIYGDNKTPMRWVPSK